MMGSLGVCSWSLRTPTAVALADRILRCGLSSTQLALDPIRHDAAAPAGGDRPWELRATYSTLQRAGIEIASGMMAMEGEDYSTLEAIRATGGVRPDSTWEINLSAARKNAEIAYHLGLTLVTFHAGFIPHEKSDPGRAVMVERLKQLADIFAEKGVCIALETGQETAEDLLAVLEDIANPMLGVNFDPANMILYGMGDPVAGLRILADHVVQMHIKDANPPARPGEWGTEMPVGKGSVSWKGIFDVVRSAEMEIDFLIERESGDDRDSDIMIARDLVRGSLGDDIG